MAGEPGSDGGGHCAGRPVGVIGPGWGVVCFCWWFGLGFGGGTDAPCCGDPSPQPPPSRGGGESIVMLCYAAFAQVMPLASQAANSFVCCSAVSFRCGGRMLSQPASPVWRAFMAFRPGISGTETAALRVAARMAASDSPVWLSQLV